MSAAEWTAQFASAPVTDWQRRVLNEIAAASEYTSKAKGMPDSVDKRLQLCNSTNSNKGNGTNMSNGIPGIDGPVSAEEESFDFQGDESAEGGAPKTPGKSRYDFDDGVYPGKGVSIKPYTSNAGNKMFLLECLGTGGPAKGIQYRKYLPLTGKGVGITERILRVFGIQPVQGTKAQYKFKSSDVTGKVCDLKLVSEEYNGQRRMKLDTVFAQRNTSNPELSNTVAPEAVPPF